VSPPSGGMYSQAMTSSPTEAQIVQQIRAEMARRDMDQATLADLSEMASSSMSRYLQGTRTMSVKTLGKISEVFGMKLDELFEKAMRLDA